MNDYNKITALYSRLSVGDEDRDGGESNSIQNQKKFLESYARQLKLTNIRHYIDDDESGRFFDRSAYSRMIEDVENGKIGVCIMKDMTRWGRDCSSQFVSRGMCVDFAIHDTDSGNPHCHIMLTMRPLDERGAWAAKSKKEYDLDENGERIRLPSGRYKTHKVDLTGWNDKGNALLWRKAWADISNAYLERAGHPERIDYRSNAERGIDELPTVHMYVHRTNNGKRISQYTCSQYTKVPCGTLCKTQHRINEDVVLSLVSEMLKAIAEYAKHDRAEFVRVVQEAQSSQQTAEVRKQRTRLATAKQRVSELEVLLCKIYEDNILGKLSDSRYATLDAQYEKEQSELTAEISVLEKAVKSYEKHEKDADRFIALIDKYENFDKLTIAMLNEFIEKILVHERDRKGSIQTTQEVEIYFNFVGRFVPPAFGEVELTPEELEEIRKREERKDRLHQNYLKRKASGAQKRYEDKIKGEKKGGNRS